jgi:hypothetical protein
MKPANLRPTTDARSCGNCLLYKSLDEYKNLISQFGAGSPLVTAYGYGTEYLAHDGICETTGDPPVLKTQICDAYIPL